MTELQQSKEDRETFTATYDVVEKQGRLDIDKAFAIKACLLIGKDLGTEGWKTTEYFSEAQTQQLVDKMHQLLLNL